MNDDLPKKKSVGNLELLFTMMILFGGLYLFMKPATNNAVLIFRIGLIAVGVIGIVVTTLIKRGRKSD